MPISEDERSRKQAMRMLRAEHGGYLTTVTIYEDGEPRDVPVADRPVDQSYPRKIMITDKGRAYLAALKEGDA